MIFLRINLLIIKATMKGGIFENTLNWEPGLALMETKSCLSKGPSHRGALIAPPAGQTAQLITLFSFLLGFAWEPHWNNVVLWSPNKTCSCHSSVLFFLSSSLSSSPFSLSFLLSNLLSFPLPFPSLPYFLSSFSSSSSWISPRPRFDPNTKHFWILMKETNLCPFLSSQIKIS